MLTSIGATAARWARARAPHTNVYGAARSLIASGTLGTLLFSRATSIFAPAAGLPTYPHCYGVQRLSPFCVAGTAHLEAARWACVLGLAVVVSGWRPRLTGILHWYIAWGLFVSGTLVDGGDQIASILALLLVPVTLTDARRWHWTSGGESIPASAGAYVARLATLSCLAVLRLQVSGLYFQAATAKLRVEEWRDGTAVYYWFNDAWFGFPHYLAGLAPLLGNPAVVAAVTWGPMMLEMFLFAGLVMDRRHRKILLLFGLAFHAGIAVVHGLLSFVLVMWGALVIYLWPLEEPFRVPARLHRRVPDGWRRAYAALRTPTPEPLSGVAPLKRTR